MKKATIYGKKCEFFEEGEINPYDKKLGHKLFVDGIRNPFNITGITGTLDKSMMLMGWQEKLTREYLLDALTRNPNYPINEEDIKLATSLHRVKKKEAGGIGSAVHEYAEHFSLGLKPEIPEEERARNGVLGFLKWIEEYKIKLKNPEQLLLSKEGYWGVGDADGTKGAKLFNVEYKTSKGIYNEHRYQAAGQLKAKEEMSGKKYEGSWLVHFDKETGEFTPLFVDRDETELDYKAFMGLFAAKQRENQLKSHAKN